MAYSAQGNKVTVLCPPPPQRFHPSGLSYFQTIEEPILRAAIAKGASLRIELVHPGVKEAQDFHYLLWPVDEMNLWIAAYGTGLCFKCKWRQISSKRAIAHKAPKKSEGKEECIVSTPVAKETAPVKAMRLSKKEKRMRKKEEKLEKKEKKTTPIPQPTTPTSYTPPSDCIASRTRSKTKAAERSGLTVFLTTPLSIKKPKMMEDARKASKANRQGCEVVQVPQTKEPVTSKKLSKKKKKKKAKQAKNAKEMTKG
jgi:hypothetical protein